MNLPESDDYKKVIRESRVMSKKIVRNSRKFLLFRGWASFRLAPALDASGKKHSALEVRILVHKQTAGRRWIGHWK